MRPGRRGRPHLLCPPCPPIGQSRGAGAEPGSGAESGGPGAGAGAGGARVAKVVRSRRRRCARLRACLSGLPRARRCHGRSTPALRTFSGTEERGHRSARGARSQDRSREAVSRRGSPRPSRPVSSVRLRGLSTVQCHRICIPRICFSQSYREPKQGRRHCVANLLGSVRPVRSGRILQRSTPVLVPFLLRGQVRLPVILHDPRTLERGVTTLSSRHKTTVSKTPRGSRQRSEPVKRKSIGPSSWDNQGCTSGLGSGPGSRHPSINIGAPSRSGTGPQVKSDPTPEPQVRSAGSLCADPPANDTGHTADDAQASDNSSDSQTEETQPQPQPQPQPQLQPQRRPSSPSKPVGSPPRATNGQSPSPVSPGSASASRGQLATGSISGSQIPSKTRPHHSRASLTSRAAQRTWLTSTTLGTGQLPVRSGRASQPAGRPLGPNRTTGRHTGPNQQTPQVSTAGRSAAAGTALAAAAPAAAATAPAATAAPTSTQRVSVSTQGSPRAQSPSTPPDPSQAGSKAPVEPGDGGSKYSKQGHKTQVAGSVEVPEVLVPCHSDSSLDYLSESTTEITCKWPDYSHQLRCPRHCWLLPHLAY